MKETTLKPNNGKKKDPAHPAIYPTGTVPKELKDRERKIYDLIVKRFMATFGKPAVRESMNVSLDINKEPFVTKGTRTVEENWFLFYKPYVKSKDTILPDMKLGEIVKIKKIEKLDKETQPPNRFNQSSIIKELEKRGLGTKATRADILDRLFLRGYIEGVQITVTQLGMETIEVLEKYASKIVDEKLTAEIEGDMKQIREGKKEQATVLNKAKDFLTKLLGDFKKKEVQIGKEILKSIRDTADVANFMGPCPKCKEGKLMIRRGKFGRFVGCDKYPDCKTILKIPKTGVAKYTNVQCGKCNYPVAEVGSGRKKQILCLNPDCPSKVGEKGSSSETKYKEEGMTCPECKEGKMVLRKSFYGEFLGCNNYPKCQTMMKIIEGKVDVTHPIVKKVGAKSSSGAKKKIIKKKAVRKKAVGKK